MPRFSHIRRSFFSQQRSFINYFIFQTLHSGNWRTTHASLIFSYSLIEWRFRELYNWRRLLASNFADRDFRIFPRLEVFFVIKDSRMSFEKLPNCGIVENVWCFPGKVVARLLRKNQIKKKLNSKWTQVFHVNTRLKILRRKQPCTWQKNSLKILLKLDYIVVISRIKLDANWTQLKNVDYRLRIQMQPKSNQF